LFPVDSSRLATWVRNAPNGSAWVRPSVDPVAEYFANALDCPRKMLKISRETRRAVSLDSTCKL